jgi:sugar/nucleoside kinase (ribokinase family)
MTPKLRLDHNDLKDTELLWAKSFHLICSPLRCIELVQSILALRREPDRQGKNQPLFIWEPVPDLCNVAEYANCLEALKYVDVVSPNNSELGGFFGQKTDGPDHVDHRVLESMCSQLLDSGIGRHGKGGIVVRCGKDGCLVASRNQSKWLPAFHQSAEKVVDPTGGGNGFLGGLAVGLARGSTLKEAAARGCVSASFAIEQVGMPVLGHDTDGETWNGVRVEDRVSEFKQRLATYVQP